MKIFIKTLIFISIHFSLFCQEQIGGDILGENPNDDFGSAVAINDDGTIVAIGAHRRNNQRGVLEVYKYEGGVWKLMGNKIEGLTNHSWLGTEVALTPSGHRLIVGAYQENITRIYDFIADDWLLTGEISLGMPSWAIHFGYAVDISNDGQTVAISATHYPQSNVHRGIVNIYQALNGQWLQLGPSIEGEFDKDQFGWDLDLSENGNSIAIGSISNSNNGHNAGQVRVFAYDNNSWHQVGNSLHGAHQHLSFGWKLDMSENGKYLIVGAPIDWTGTENKQHYAEVYELRNGDWKTKGSKIYGQQGQHFGYDVAISDDGERIAVSAIQDENCPIQIYDFMDSDWELTGAISHNAEYHNLGFSIAMNPNGEVIIGTSRTPEGFAVVYDLRELEAPNCVKAEAVDSIITEAVDSINIYFPNAIRPNSRNIEHTVLFGQSNIDITYSLSVFDRWGNLVFDNQFATTNLMQDGWKPSSKFSQGVYVYIVRYIDQEKERIIRGDLILTR